MSATSIPIFTYKHTSNTTLSIPQIHIKLTEQIIKTQIIVDMLYMRTELRLALL
jgi:hypothetical protein